MTRLTLWWLRWLLPGALLLVTMMVFAGEGLPRQNWDVLAYLQRPLAGYPRLHLADFTRSLDVDVTPPGYGYSSPDWSPDGRQLVALVRIPYQYIFLVRLGVNGQIVQQFFDDSRSSIAPQWSPDGAQLAFSQPDATSANLYTLYVTRLDADGYGSEPRLLTSYNIPSNFWGREANSSAFTWTADSRSLIFTASEGALNAVDPLYYTTWLHEISVDEGKIQTIRNDVQNIIAPALSPDNTQIAFISNWDTGILRLYVMNRDGSAMHQLENLYFESVPAWSRDGQEIGYWLRENSLSLFYTIELATGAKRLRYTTDQEIQEADWRP